MMRKSREFDNILDECLEHLLVKGGTIEQCLQSFPKHADELKPLLETALATKQVSAIQPRSEFRDKARYQFYSALQEMEHKKSRPFFSWGWQPRWVTTIAIVLILLLSGGGTVAAASGSMPDEFLYPVKLATEQAQLVFTPSALGKAELYAKLADKRVSEIVRMAEKNKPEQIERTAQRLDTYLTKIAVLSSTQEVTGDVAMTPALEETPAARGVPLPEEEVASEEAFTVEEAPSPTEQAGGDKEARIKVDRRGKLRAIVVRQSNNNTARLHALLDTVPESAKPALEQAIAVSENGYKKALESLD